MGFAEQYRVEIHKVGGGYQSTPFPNFALAERFFNLHTNEFSELVELKRWDAEYVAPEYARTYKPAKEIA